MSNPIKFSGGVGQYISGIPARDLTQDEWDTLPKDKQKLALDSGLYKVQKEAASYPQKTNKVEE